MSAKGWMPETTALLAQQQEKQMAGK